MTTILQISDTHIMKEGALVSRRLDTFDALSRLVGHIGDIRDQVGPIDAVLLSGDVSDDGSNDSYVRAKALLAPLDLPTYVIPGNHDARDPMRAAFADHLPHNGRLNWAHKVGDVYLIGLDTLVEGQGGGTLTPETLAFLSNALSEADGAAVLLALHHPPFASGIDFMDTIGLSNAHDLSDTVTGYNGELRIVCGHIHNLMVANIAGHTAMSAPSPSSTFPYDLRSNAPVGFMTLEGGCLLHRWNSGFRSVRIGPVSGAGPYPF
ncbi:phosphodiesterase [Parasedimentitalea marina]|uniref:Phosphodiesterase n=1 Tax=Parasedimentitalea marina TaxID=2483033 RepID=A0A3T0N4H2_9RHOB|nr:phosphodiesterase [Parasedimentitalea marina]AZV78915.1 phosphodiesterase [Parasedimentitalea marina]